MQPEEQLDAKMVLEPANMAADRFPADGKLLGPRVKLRCRAATSKTTRLFMGGKAVLGSRMTK